MQKTIFSSLIIFCISIFYSFGQAFIWQNGAKTIQIDPITENVFRVIYSDKKVNFPDSSNSVVDLPFLPPVYETGADKSGMWLECGDCKIEIVDKPFSINFQRNGKLLLSQKGLPFVKKKERGFSFSVNPDAPIYGAGMQATAFDRRGETFEMYNRPQYAYEYGRKDMNYNQPFLFSSEKFILFFDNPQKAWLDICDSESDIVEFKAIGGSLSYYVIIDTTFSDLMRDYTQIIGYQEIPPRWALGNLMSRMAYETEKQTKETVSQMRNENFPLDAVILDLFWFGDTLQTTMGNLEWYKPSWPNPEKMISDFDAQGVKTILITEPYIVKTSLKWREADSLGILAKNRKGESYVIPDFYFGQGSLLDVFNKKSKDWMCNVYDRLKAQGVAGWWVDLAEPEYHPADMIHSNGTGDQIHNIYGHYWDKMMFDHWEKNYPDVRLFNLNRSGWIGSQRYSVFPWSGDVSRSWGGLKAQLPIMLSLSLGGVPYNHSDLGGFALGEWDDELYTRWLQFGTFSPIFRLHASGDVPSEPIFFSDSTKNRAREAINLRYKLMPYIYSLAFENSQKGTPIVLPIFFENGNRKTFSVESQYMFGPSLMVAPVLEKGLKQREIYLPGNCDWYDFYTGKRYNGGQTIVVDLTLDNIPLFVKAGSILPTVPLYNNADNYSSDTIILQVFPGNNNTTSSFTMFEDDGETRNSFLKKEYELLNFEGEYKNGVVKIKLSKSGFSYKNMPKNRVVEVVIYNMQNNPEINQLAVRGVLKNIEKSYYPKSKKVILSFPWDGAYAEISLFDKSISAE